MLEWLTYWDEVLSRLTLPGFCLWMGVVFSVNGLFTLGCLWGMERFLKSKGL